MAQTDAPAVTFAAGFQLMRRMRDQDFRAFLGRHGWQPGEHVVIAADHEPVIDVMARVILHDTGGHAMIAIVDEERQFGFRLMRIGVTPPRRRGWLRRRVETIDIAPNASVGLLYDAFRRCGEYVPSEWTTPMTVRKEPERV